MARLVSETRRHWGGVDVLVNSAAVRLNAPAREGVSAADFAEVLRINLVGAFVLTKIVAGPMRERGGGSIVHIGSALGRWRRPTSRPTSPPRAVSTAGPGRRDRAGRGRIRVNVVAPGTIDTAIEHGVQEFRRRMLEHRIPIARPGHVDDIAAACLYLASDAAGYVTGSVLAVDGGWTAS